MADMIKTGNTVLGQTLMCKKQYNARNIVTVALDGTPYIQNTGTAENRRDIYIYCSTKDRRDKADNASNTGALITARWKNETIYGYIEENIEWQEWRDEHGVGHFTLLVSEVVADAES